MATNSVRSKPMEGETRFLIRNVGWEGYQCLVSLLSERGVRITYDRGSVELMSPLFIHERSKKLLGRMVETIAEELDIQLVAAGSTTIEAPDLDRGLEPDECYYLASAPRLRDVDRITLAIDPPPDLAIEVEITRGALMRLEIYASLGVPEVWRYDGEALNVLLLEPDGTYRPSDRSLAFPFVPILEIIRFLHEYDPNNDTRWARAFRAWVREEVLPRYLEGDGAPDNEP